MNGSDCAIISRLHRSNNGQKSPSQEEPRFQVLVLLACLFFWLLVFAFASGLIRIGGQIPYQLEKLWSLADKEAIRG